MMYPNQRFICVYIDICSYNYIYIYMYIYIYILRKGTRRPPSRPSGSSRASGSLVEEAHVCMTC